MYVCVRVGWQGESAVSSVCFERLWREGEIRSKRSRCIQDKHETHTLLFYIFFGITKNISAISSTQFSGHIINPIMPVIHLIRSKSESVISLEIREGSK